MTARLARGGFSTSVVPWSPGDRDVPRRSAEALRGGGVVAHPTETVYGLAAAADDERGFRGLLRLKGGTTPRTFLLLFADRAALEARVGPLPPGGAELADSFWPGPLTLLMPAPADLPRWWSGPEGDVAARVTSHPFARALIEELGGPVLSTSANPAGVATPATAAQVAGAFGDPRPAFVVDGGTLAGLPSTLVRWGERGWSVAREGALSTETLDGLLGPPAFAPAAPARGSS